MSKKRPTEAEVNYRYVGSATKSIHRSVKQASRDLQSDYEKILRTYTEKGGFSSRQEALDYLNGHVQPEGYQALVEAARKIQDPDVRRRELTRLSTDAYKFRLSRAKACDIAQGYHARQLQEDIRKDLGQAKAKTAVTASEQALFNAQKAVGTGIGFDLPNTDQIRQIAYGTATEKKIKLFSDSEMKGIREVMDAGILSGRSWDDVAKQCEAHTDKDFYKVRRLVRTEMAQASVDAEIAELEELGYEQYEVHCTLDEVTCEICGQYDGEVFKVGDTAHLPTYHPNCRCYITPVTDGKGSRSARDAKGKSVKVPAGMRYPEWREKYTPELKVQHRKFEVVVAEPSRNTSRRVEPFRSVGVGWDDLTQEEKMRDYLQRVEEINNANNEMQPRAAPSKALFDSEYTSADAVDWDWRNDLSKKEIETIRDYTGENYVYYNKALFDSKGFVKKYGIEGVDKVMKEVKKIQILDDVIKKSEIKEPIVAFRCTDRNPFGEAFSKALEGRDFVLQGFTSASIGGYLDLFGEYQIKLISPSGNGIGVYVGYKGLSSNHGEQEIIFKRNLHIHV
ncbi:MAG: minor capsid protein, partial [Candidatus Methanomethylophilaceae archaeon]|nr:minor capsid protein [Candidatus Methanomethylophilaceae archaeon]